MDEKSPKKTLDPQERGWMSHQESAWSQRDPRVGTGLLKPKQNEDLKASFCSQRSLNRKLAAGCQPDCGHSLRSPPRGSAACRADFSAGPRRQLRTLPGAGQTRMHSWTAGRVQCHYWGSTHVPKASNVKLNRGGMLVPDCRDKPGRDHLALTLSSKDPSNKTNRIKRRFGA